MDGVQWVAVLAAITLLVISLFRLALAAGLRWGVAAWGGEQRILPLVRVTSWACAAFLALNTLGNLSSASPVEQAVMTPVAATFAICFVIV